MKTLSCNIRKLKRSQNEQTDKQTNKQDNKQTKKTYRDKHLHLHNYDLFKWTHSLYLHVIHTNTTGSSDVSNTDARALHALLPETHREGKD